MFDFHEKRKIRSVLYSKPVAFGMFFCAILLSISVYDRLQVVGEIREKTRVRQDELVKLEERAQVLQSKVEYLENDRGIEEEIRGRFDVARDGEQVVVLINGQEEKQKGSGTSSVDVNPRGDKPALDEKEKKNFRELFKFW